MRDLALTINEPISKNRQLAEHSLPSTFAEVVKIVKTFILQEFDCEIAKNQLYYHTREHIDNVQRRADIIFQAIHPYCPGLVADDIARTSLLLNLCAVAHDGIQIFSPQTQPYTSRQRQPGVSETLTIEKLLNYIKDLNQQLQEQCVDDSVLFTDADMTIIQEAIEATICAYDAANQSIYQPALYNQDKNLSLVAKILAIADIGSLGMDGVAAFNKEGGLLFLEENPDIVPIILDQTLETLNVDNPELYENIRQRLLKRARFQINFAKSRLMRFPQELTVFPVETIPILIDIFQYLNPETIQEIELTTPTEKDTSLEVLLDFFQLKQLVKEYS